MSRQRCLPTRGLSFTADDVDTAMYGDGTKVYTFFAQPLLAFGEQGIAGVFNGSSFHDLLEETSLALPAMT